MNLPREMPDTLRWSDHTRVPYWLYRDPDIYQRELERIFYGPFWHAVALLAELPSVNDYKTVTVGEAPLLVTRTGQDSYEVLVNACAHRGVQLAGDFRGHATDFTCPYHAWVFDNAGNLQRAPGEERFAPGFKREQFGLRKLRTAVHGQVLWATFDDTTPPVKDFLGEVNASFLTAMGGGDRPLELLGYQKIVFNCNWKVYMDNDGYHAGLLHTAFRLLGFGGGKAQIIADGTAGSWGAHYEFTDYQDNGYLDDPSIVQSGGPDKSAAVNLIRPLTQAVKHINTINFRFGKPLGPEQTEVHYCYLGYADDAPEVRRHRIRQAVNLLGPSGFVSIEDGSVFERVQKGLGAPGGTVNFIKGLADSPDGHYSEQNDEAGNTPWWRDYRQRMDL